jgi:hypothetical protein
MNFFEIGFLKLFCPGWLQTSILLVSASWVAGITGVSQQCLAIVLLIMKELTVKLHGHQKYLESHEVQISGAHPLSS